MESRTHFWRPQAGRLASRRAPTGAVIFGTIGVLAACVLVAHSIPQMSDHVPKPLAGVMGLALLVLLWVVPTDKLFFGWLLLAPLLQESAGRTRAGHIVQLALYTIPPLVFALKVFITRGPRPRREWFDYFPALFALLVMVSLLAVDRSALSAGAVGVLRGYYEVVGIGVIVYYVVAFWRGRALSPIVVMGLILASALLQASMAVIEWQTGRNLWNDTGVRGAGDVRSVTTLANPALTGAFIGVGIVVALAVLCWSGPIELRRLSQVMLIVGMVGIYTTKTRGPILATAAVGLACVMFSARSRLAGVAAVSLVSLSLIALWPTIQASTVYRARITQRSNVDARLVLQKVSIRLAEQRPILGWGYGSFDRLKYSVDVSSNSIALDQALQSTSHDSYLTILVEYGLVGLAFFVLPGVVLFKRAIRRVRRSATSRWLYMGCMGGTLVVVVTGGTIDFRFFSFVPALVWLFLGLIRRQSDGDARASLAIEPVRRAV